MGRGRTSPLLRISSGARNTWHSAEAERKATTQPLACTAKSQTPCCYVRAGVVPGCTIIIAMGRIVLNAMIMFAPIVGFPFTVWLLVLLRRRVAILNRGQYAGERRTLACGALIAFGPAMVFIAQVNDGRDISPLSIILCGVFAFALMQVLRFVPAKRVLDMVDLTAQSDEARIMNWGLFMSTLLVVMCFAVAALLLLLFSPQILTFLVSLGGWPAKLVLLPGILFIGVALSIFKRRAQFFYGACEVLFAMGGSWKAVGNLTDAADPLHATIANWATLLAAMYVVQRGITNCHEALAKVGLKWRESPKLITIPLATRLERLSGRRKGADAMPGADLNCL